jgi:hypothetical protein
LLLSYLSSLTAVFFEVCAGVLKALIRPAGGETGILGEVSTYFGAVRSGHASPPLFGVACGKPGLLRLEEQDAQRPRVCPTNG